MTNDLEIDGVRINPTKLNRIFTKVMMLERKNLKSKSYTKSAMVQELSKIIREEVNKNG